MKCGKRGHVYKAPANALGLSGCEELLSENQESEGSVEAEPAPVLDCEGSKMTSREGD